MSKATKSTFIENVNDPAMLKYLDYYGGLAHIRVAAIDLFAMPFEIENFVEDDAYWATVDRVRRYGYDNSSPIKVHRDASGRWIVDEEDGDRFAAAKKVAGEIFTNLLSAKVRFVRFDLHTQATDEGVHIWGDPAQVVRQI